MSLSLAYAVDEKRCHSRLQREFDQHSRWAVQEGDGYFQLPISNVLFRLCSEDYALVQCLVNYWQSYGAGLLEMAKAAL